MLKESLEVSPLRSAPMSSKLAPAAWPSAYFSSSCFRISATLCFSACMVMRGVQMAVWISSSAFSTAASRAAVVRGHG